LTSRKIEHETLKGAHSHASTSDKHEWITHCLT